MNDCAIALGSFLLQYPGLSKSDQAIKMREGNTEAAIWVDAVGAPSFVYNGEIFWDQGRLEYLDHLIASGRGAFSSEV